MRSASPLARNDWTAPDHDGRKLGPAQQVNVLRRQLPKQTQLNNTVVQFAVSVATSSSTGASSGTAAAVLVVSSHSIGSGLRIIARASTSSMRETGTIS